MAFGRSRGGFSTKIHIRADAQGLPLVITLTGGEVHDSKAYDDLMVLGEDDPDALLADKAYDSDYIRADLKHCSIKAVIPPTLTINSLAMAPTTACICSSRLGGTNGPGFRPNRSCR